LNEEEYNEELKLKLIAVLQQAAPGEKNLEGW
jgi:hypothetical protein